jgi:hypothetical protein
MPFVSMGNRHEWSTKRAGQLQCTHVSKHILIGILVYDRVGMDIYAGAGLFPPTAGYYVSDLDALKVSRIQC